MDSLEEFYFKEESTLNNLNLTTRYIEGSLLVALLRHLATY